MINLENRLHSPPVLPCEIDHKINEQSRNNPIALLETTKTSVNFTGIYVPQKSTSKHTWILMALQFLKSCIKSETNGCLVLTRRKSSLKTNKFSIDPYLVEIRKEKGSR